MIAGTAIGTMVGFALMPAEARIGLPLRYAAIPITGAIIGAAAGGVIDAAIRRRLDR
jgi:hypothetical protein